MEGNRWAGLLLWPVVVMLVWIMLLALFVDVLYASWMIGEGSNKQ